jgi:hypothetical protein
VDIETDQEISHGDATYTGALQAVQPPRWIATAPTGTA